MFENILIIFLIFNLPVLIFYKKITNIIDVFDEADNIRKFHKKKVPLFGGIILIYNFLIFFSLESYLELGIFIDFDTTREYFSFIMAIIGFFFIGFYDDKFKLSANKKLFLNSFLILILILIDEKLIIKELNFTFTNYPVELRNFSYLFTILCILLFINALNMFDGINLQVGSYCIIIFSIFILKSFFIQLSWLLILSIILFLYFNYKNKAFLGDSGTQILAFIISYFFIKSHNNDNTSFSPEEIFIILSLPGLDMFRLFLLRLINGHHPFYPDRNHIHHLMMMKFSNLKTFFFTQSFVLVNIFLYYFFSVKLLSIMTTIILYIICIMLIQKKGK